jgi:hypothetical protein
MITSPKIINTGALKANPKPNRKLPAIMEIMVVIG